MSLESTPEVTTEMEASAPAVTEESSAPQADANPVTEGSLAPEQGAAPVQPQYQPNFKYKVRDQEKEIDEMFRALVKDAESEKKIKELFEKADGLDFVKEDRKTIKSEYEGFKKEITPYLQEYHKFTTLRDKGNLGAALQVAGITDEQIFQYALQKLEMEQNPNQANLYKNHTEASLREIEMEAKLQHYELQNQQMEQMKFQQDLDNAIASTMDVAKMVDEKLGKNGAFKEEVIALGVFEFNRGNNLSIQDAVSAVAAKYKPFISAPAQAPQAPQHQRPATIPNVASSNVSAIKRKPTSLEDIRKLAQEA